MRKHWCEGEINAKEQVGNRKCFKGRCTVRESAWNGLARPVLKSIKKIDMVRIQGWKNRGVELHLTRRVGGFCKRAPLICPQGPFWGNI